ncbi:MAG: hypothetical protein Dasosvirus1_16 [Dasosvirus sp.]|uniref:Uncharacterized protein n=1 Tax=Dasosvirus sp. TaxID=2487764 RepID=A0A3G4ZTQ0_9VIRU|nr:MAG: hypothetical protein Dasosvirus1_16 [Dasosvirus sp.]
MSELSVYLTIDIIESTNIHHWILINVEYKFEFKEENWSIIFHKINNTQYRITANKFNKNEQENSSKIDKELEELSNYDKKIEDALKKTDENIARMTKDFYTKIATEKDFGSEFTENNQELFGRIAGDVRILAESKKILENNRSKKNISIKKMVSERFTWVMEIGERCTRFGMKFNLCKDIPFPDCDVKQNYEEVEIPILFQESTKKYIRVIQKSSNGTLCDIICWSGKIMRALVVQNGEIYTCSYQDMLNNVYQMGDFKEQIGINENKVFPVNVNLQNKITDFKIGEKVLALFVQASGFCNCFLYSGTIDKIINQTISVKFDDGDYCDVEVDKVRKIGDIPEKYRVQKGRT